VRSWFYLSPFVSGVSIPSFEKAMSFEMGEEFLEIRFHRVSGHGELTTDFVRDLSFGEALLQKFEHSRADQVQSEHLPVTDIEDDSSVLAMCGPDIFWDSHDLESLPRSRVRSDSPDIATPGRREL
jgi:hypothetical protein